MNLETWVTYAIACAVLSVIPGPSVLMITGQALTKGLSAAFVCLLGETVGGSLLIILSLMGMGTLLAASSTLFFIIKWLGVAYLAYVGISQLIEARNQQRKPTTHFLTPQKNPTAKPSMHTRSSFSIGFFTALLNPKAIVFYMAFLSQFFDPSKNHLVQYVLLIVTSAIVAGFILTCYALAASKARDALKSPKATRNVGYASGGFYLGGSVLMATSK